MNIGDKVRPTRIVPVSNKKNMFEDEIGTIVKIENGNQMITVKETEMGKSSKLPTTFGWRYKHKQNGSHNGAG